MGHTSQPPPVAQTLGPRSSANQQLKPTDSTPFPSTRPTPSTQLPSPHVLWPSCAHSRPSSRFGPRLTPHTARSLTPWPHTAELSPSSARYPRRTPSAPLSPRSLAAPWPRSTPRLCLDPLVSPTRTSFLLEASPLEPDHAEQLGDPLRPRTDCGRNHRDARVVHASPRSPVPFNWHRLTSLRTSHSTP